MILGALRATRALCVAVPTAMITIRRVRELPADLSPLISASLAEGFRFLERLRDDWASGQFSRLGVAANADHRESPAGNGRARGFSRLPPGDPDATHVLQIAQEGVTLS